MFTSSAFSTSNTYIKYKIQVEQLSQDIANNTSKVGVYVQFYRTNTGYTTYGSGTVYCKIDGTTYTSSVTSADKITEDGAYLFWKTITISHDSDGSKDLAVSAWIEHDVFSSSSQGFTVTLDTIARGSTLSASNGKELGTAQTLTVTRQSTALTHTITYTCGTASGTICTKSSSTSISWTPPLSLASQNTTGTDVTILLKLTTYNGSTTVGTYERTIWCAIPDSVKPSCSFVLEDITGADDIYGSPVQNLSKIKITVNATQAYGSPIASYKITANGATYTTSTATTALLKNSGTSRVTATVTDKRGRTGTVYYDMNVQAYNLPGASALSVHRCNSDGTENANGVYAKVTFSAAVSSMSSKNTAAYSLQYKKTSATEWTTHSFTALNNVYSVTNQTYIFAADDGSAYDVQVLVTDKHSTGVRTTTVSTAFVLMHFGDDGTSMGIGRVADTANRLQIGLQTEFDDTIVQKGNRYAFSTPGVAGTAGYILMARISIIAANADTPITFVFSQRRAISPMTVHLTLLNSTMTASSLSSIVYEGTNYGAFAIQSSEMVWDLYVQKGSTYDTITVQDWWMSRTMEDRVKVTFPGTLVDALPGEYWRATPAKLQSLLDHIFPVGSVYFTQQKSNPADLFGGTWQIVDKCLIGSRGNNNGVGYYANINLGDGTAQSVLWLVAWIRMS